jgi:hypothetical protein
MKDAGGTFHGKHLKRSLDYVLNPDKTQGGRLVGAVNCLADRAFDQMSATKRQFGKTDKRQGYHIILSFKENEVDPDLAFGITHRFVEEYLGSDYEAVFAVHDNTDHVHSHIIFNSVGFMDGRKYRYKKGDWAKYIQPITNKLCAEYGLSIIDVEEMIPDRKHDSYNEWSEKKESNQVWSDIIRRDIDACILQSFSYENFLQLLQDKGYDIKQGKYLAVKPKDMNRFKRCKTLGDNYSEEIIRIRIQSENLHSYQSSISIQQPKIVSCKVKYCRRAKMSGLQKRYFFKMYRTRKSMRRPYNQAWKYREDIKKMKILQERYLLLTRHNITNIEELTAVISNLTDKRAEALKKKRIAYKQLAGYKHLFEISDEMKRIQYGYEAYINGDTYFAEEYNRYVEKGAKLAEAGYSHDEVVEFQKVYKENASEACKLEWAVRRELGQAKAIFAEIVEDMEGRLQEQEHNREKKKEKTTERNSNHEPKR